HATYQISEHPYNEHTSYTLQNEYESRYTIDPQGRQNVDPRYLFPLTRNIPLFPEADVSPGITWSAPALEIHDFSVLFGIEEPYRIPITVNYVYQGNKVIDNRTLAEIKITYTFLHNISGISPNPEFGYYPVKVGGVVENLYYFDIERGKPHSFSETFDIVYTLDNGHTVEFIGEQNCEVIAAPVLDKKKTTKDIANDIEKEHLEGVRVESSDKGITIVLENIQFEPDSDVILQSEKGKLNRIAGILKKYPERDILIVGHTAGLGTKEYLDNLSQKRAKSVGDYLLQLGARKASQMTIVGRGASEPIANNDTEEGRKKNRRVEIIILEN
ncbi:MAG TPA: OmpA family protein, partial [Spirochaetia bacterium]|nr:OmpA family protein [Spirochaetia bacterium]